MSQTLTIRGRGNFPAFLLPLAAIPAGLAALPVFYVVMRSSDAGFAGMISEIIRPATRELLASTLILAGSVTFLSAALAIAFAWATERCALPGKGALRVIATLPLAMPAFVASYAWASLGPWFQGMAGAILILTLNCVPLIYLPFAAALKGMDPAFEEAARTLGRSRWQAFGAVILPQAAPALGAGALLVFSHMLAEFGALSFLQVQTFTTAIFQQYDIQFDSAAAALLSSILLLLCLPVVMMELRLRDNRRLSRLGRGNARPLPLIALSAGVVTAALSGFALFAALAVGAPLVTLFYWLVTGTSAGTGLERLLPAVWGSLSFSLPGAALTTALALPLVLLSMRRGGAAVSLAERLPFVIHGLPGLVIALALVFFSIRYAPWAYQSWGLVLVAYVMLFLPQAQSSIRASAELVSPELEDVARTLGESPLRAFARVTLPNLIPGLGAGLALVTLQLMRELTATLLLAPSGVSTLATEFWSYTNERAFAAAAPFAAALVIVSGVPVFLFTLRGLRRG